MPLPGRLHEGGVGHEARPEGVSCGGEKHNDVCGGDEDADDEKEQEDP